MTGDPASRAESGPYQAAILLVDENEPDRMALEARLKAMGYEVLSTGIRESAEAKLEGEGISLILLGDRLGSETSRSLLEDWRSSGLLRDRPVILVAGMAEPWDVAEGIEAGAVDYLSSPFDPTLLHVRIQASLENCRLRRQEEEAMKRLADEKVHSDRLVKGVIPLGISLIQEQDYGRLLERILEEAMAMCRADGGTLYLARGDDSLEFKLLQNETLGIKLGGRGELPVTFPPLRLHDPETGEPNHFQVACHAVWTGQSVNIPDAYHAEGFDFRGTREFDQRTGYRSQSFLTVPLMAGNSGRVKGVLQLINAREDGTGKVIPFTRHGQAAVESLGLLAAAALEKYDLAGTISSSAPAAPGS